MRELHGWRDARGRRLATAARVIAAGSLALALSTPQAARAGADDERALASPDDAARSAVWVFFTGKGAGAPGLSSALERR
ncbi:MAG: hypothetical protein H6713_43245, partial [Myxococcales bacterium]|nr:hypothetical protein [Myxococcales bacterium]